MSNWKKTKEGKRWMKEYYKKYSIKNKDKLSERRMKHYYATREKSLQRGKLWRENHPEKCRKYAKKDRLKYPLQHKARQYAYNNTFKRPFCLLHLLEDQFIEAIHFHHTDYEINLGFSVCMEHHKIADTWS